jgi:hypothetical protein
MDNKMLRRCVPSLHHAGFLPRSEQGSSLRTFLPD